MIFDVEHKDLLAEVRSHVERAFGLDGMDSSTDETHLADLGLDSIVAVELAARLRDRFQVPLPSTVTFEAPTIKALADFIFALRQRNR